MLKSSKKVNCSSWCTKCTNCTCTKAKEFCSSKCGCDSGTCGNQPKAIVGYPVPPWKYTSDIKFNTELSMEETDTGPSEECKTLL